MGGVHSFYAWLIYILLPYLTSPLRTLRPSSSFFRHQADKGIKETTDSVHGSCTEAHLACIYQRKILIGAYNSRAKTRLNSSRWYIVLDGVGHIFSAWSGKKHSRRKNTYKDIFRRLFSLFSCERLAFIEIARFVWKLRHVSSQFPPFLCTILTNFSRHYFCL